MIKVFDDVIDSAGQKEIADILLGWQFPWYHYANTNYADQTTRDDDVPQFTHGFIRENQKNSPHAKIPLIILEKMNIPLPYILRAKANLLMREQVPFTHPAHIDDSKPHVGMIYYVNDSDGDTHFYEGKSGAETIQTVRPKAGRAVMFDGQTYHASASPTAHRYRIVINYNLEMDDWFGAYEGPKR